MDQQKLAKDAWGVAVASLGDGTNASIGVSGLMRSSSWWTAALKVLGRAYIIIQSITLKTRSISRTLRPEIRRQFGVLSRNKNLHPVMEYLNILALDGISAICLGPILVLPFQTMVAL